jgi:hypothetical protein
MLGLMLHGAMGRLGEAADVEGFEFQHLVVRPTLAAGHKEVVVAFDGEVARMRSPISIRVRDQPLFLQQAPAALGGAGGYGGLSAAAPRRAGVAVQGAGAAYCC